MFKLTTRGLKKGVKIFLLVFVALVIIRIPAVMKQEKSAETAEWIESRRLVMADVDGSSLPPAPDPGEVDATIEGVDANENYIRDDVELAIFALYPDDIKLRSASLQYAMALQIYLTKVFSEETWVAGAAQNSRGSGCVFQTIPDVSLNNTEEEIKEAFKIGEDRQNLVLEMVLNTEARSNLNESLYEDYLVTHSGYHGEECDLDT